MTSDTSAAGALGALAWRGWVVLRDRAAPGKRRGTLDHVLVGPGGVFVVARTKWPGPVEVVDGVLQLGGQARPHDITEVSEAAAEVLALVPEVPVHPVFCLERHQPVTAWVRNVMLCASSNVEEVLTTRPVVLGPERVQQVAEVLASRLLPATPVPSPETTPPTRGAAPRSVRVLLHAVTLALAALLVISVLQTRAVDEISAAVDGFVSDGEPVGDEPIQESAQPQPREQTTPSPDPTQITVKGRQIQIDKPKRRGQRHADQDRGQRHTDQDRRKDPGKNDARRGRLNRDQGRSRD